jgi:hypothetical protein
MLGAQIGAGSGLDSHGELNALKSQLPASLDLFADVVRNPAPAADIERIRGQWLAAIAQKDQPGSTLRIRRHCSCAEPRLRHSIHRTGTEASIKSWAEDAFPSRLHSSGQCRDPVAGDTTLAEITAGLIVPGSWDAVRCRSRRSPGRR